MTKRGKCSDCPAEATRVLYWHSPSLAAYTRTLLCELHWTKRGGK